MIKLEEKALHDLEKIILNNELEKLSYNQICFLIEVFSLYKNFEFSQKLIDFFNKKISWNNKFIIDEKHLDDIFFETRILKSITLYFREFKKKEVIKKNIKLVEVLIKKIQKNFCDEYLLIYNKNKNYFAKENFLFLNFCDELSDILNEFEFTKIADQIFLLKGKLELGVQRYLIQKKEIINFFNTNSFRYKISNLREKINLVEQFNFDNEELKDLIKLALVEFENIKNVEFKLEILLFLKNFQNEFEKLNLKKIKKLLKDFPKYIVKEKEFSIEIENSLFPLNQIKFHEYKKEKLISYNLENLNSKILFLLVFKD